MRSAPDAANFRAVAAPNPRPAPVIRATFPVSGINLLLPVRLFNVAGFDYP
jgi:hypothetical protein